MRTTISIDGQVLERAKQRAQADDVTLGRFIESAIQEKLAAGPAERGPSVPVFTRGSGPRPGVDASSNRGLFEALGGE